jgi:hypothetical protein
MEGANVAMIPLKLINSPDAYNEAMRFDKALEWQQALEEEMASIAKTWSLEDMPKGHKQSSVAGCVTWKLMRATMSSDLSLDGWKKDTVAALNIEPR